MFSNCQEILLSRYLYSKLISILKFLSNSKTMFWVISLEQHSIKTQEFTETISYFYSFTYEKNIWRSSSHQWIDFFLWICWHTEKLWIQHQNIICLLEIQTSLLFFSLHKIQLSKQHSDFDSMIQTGWWFILIRWNFVSRIFRYQFLLTK